MAAAAAAAGGPGRGLWVQDAASAARRRPALTAASLTALALTTGLARSVPDRSSLEAAAVAAGAALAQLPPGSRSPRAERHVQRLLRLRERGRLRVRSFGIIAVAGSDPHGEEPALYRARCPHLRRRGELLDLGFLGRWWMLEAALRDSDINEEEFGHLAEPLRALRPRELRSERNERLHREGR
ncbi:mitochondrial import inner membrane translocase subunit Tim29, partial [Pyrgilauda ruficollis]|uniref:mitochondrial import inner membrane translocase subunit Tim29 n=1 Tax=Pyrgilauda ruficollis TaxID=221976 RepID=UPI001B88150C